MAKLTLEALSPVRTFRVLDGFDQIVEIVAHHSQVQEGVLEFFMVVNNHTCIVASFAVGFWRCVTCAPPTREELAKVEAATQEVRDEQKATADAAVQQAIELSAKEAFLQFKH